MPTSPQALYLYGITRESAPPPATESVDGAFTIEALACGSLICWVSPIQAADFGARLADASADLEWLAEAGTRHQRAVEALAERATILPAKFGTVFLTADSLIADVARRRRTLTAAFKRVEGAEEWGVKVFSAPPPVSPGPKAGSSGREYLQRKSETVRFSARRGVDQDIRAFAAALTRAAAAACAGGPIAGGQPGLIWHASFLVRRAKRARFDGIVTRFARTWAGARRIECTGPWPPYSFVGK